MVKRISKCVKPQFKDRLNMFSHSYFLPPLDVATVCAFGGGGAGLTPTVAFFDPLFPLFITQFHPCLTGQSTIVMLSKISCYLVFSSTIGADLIPADASTLPGGGLTGGCCTGCGGSKSVPPPVTFCNSGGNLTPTCLNSVRSLSILAAPFLQSSKPLRERNSSQKYSGSWLKVNRCRSGHNFGFEFMLIEMVEQLPACRQRSPPTRCPYRAQCETNGAKCPEVGVRREYGPATTLLSDPNSP